MLQEESKSDLLTLLFKAYRQLRKKVWILVLFLIAGSALGILNAYFLNDHSEKWNRRILIHRGITERNDLAQIIGTLYVKKKGQKEILLSPALNLTESEAEDVVSFSPDIINYQSPNVVIALVTVYRQSLLDKIQRELSLYLDKNEFLRKNTDSSIQARKRIIASTDSLLSSPSLAPADRIELMKKKSELQLEIQNAGVKIIGQVDSKINNQYQSVQVVAGWILLFLFAGILFVFLLYFMRNAKKFSAGN